MDEIIKKNQNKPEKGYRELPDAYENVFNWKHLKDRRLYNYNGYAVEALKKGIDLSKDGFNNKNLFLSKTNYHCYWYGNIDRKQVFSIKSFLCTHDLNISKVILWLDINNGFKNYKNNPFLKEILPFIEVRMYDPLLEVVDTPWKGYEIIPTQAFDLVARCDAFRFLILYKYGGVYFDLDVMFLRDLSELLDSEFCYTWENLRYANSAILNIKQGSDISKRLLQKSVEKNSPSPWNIFIYSDLSLKDLFVFPCAFFDPIWQGLESENAPFTEFFEFFRPFNGEFTNKFDITSYKEFFPGCYAYHWHNKWDAIEHENSFFGIFEKEFNELLKYVK